MAYETLNSKKFLNATGVGYLWEKIRDRYDSKLDSVEAANDSILVTNNNTIQVVVSSEADNLLQLKTTGNKGLYVAPSASADTYAVVKVTTDPDYAATYKLMKYTGGTGSPSQVGVDINIPKDMVVESGSVVTKAASGDWGAAGTYIELVLANATNDHLYIPVDSLIEYVTSGSQVGDMVFITIDAQHRVTAAITDDSITAAKLAPAIRTQLAKADNSVQSVTSGSTAGAISVDGTSVPVYGLGTAAYADTTAFEPAGAVSSLVGNDTDTASMYTLHGVKQYASDVYSAIVPLTTTEIDNAVTAANASIDG